MLNTSIKATVYSVQLAVGPNGEKYVKTFIGLNAKSDDEYTKGLSLMSMSTDPKVFDLLPDVSQPFEADIEITMLRGGQNKMKQHVVGITPSVSASAPRPAAKA